MFGLTLEDAARALGCSVGLGDVLDDKESLVSKLVASLDDEKSIITLHRTETIREFDNDLIQLGCLDPIQKIIHSMETMSSLDRCLEVYSSRSLFADKISATSLDQVIEDYNLTSLVQTDKRLKGILTHIHSPLVAKMYMHRADNQLRRYLHMRRSLPFGSKTLYRKRNIFRQFQCVVGPHRD